MKAYIFIATLMLLTGCITGNPWEQFMANVEHYYKGRDYSEAKEELALGGRYEITPEDGYELPNGNRQHEIDWGTRKGATGTLIMEVDSQPRKIVSAGGKGGMYACQWGG